MQKWAAHKFGARGVCEFAFVAELLTLMHYAAPAPGKNKKHQAEKEAPASSSSSAGGGGEFIVVFAESDGVSSALSTSGISILSP